MHRALTVAVVLAVVAGSVPAAASLADGTPSTPEPGASFAGVVGVQESEVDNEVANRSLNNQLRAASTNRSKASVVAGESQQLEQRLAELEAEKARLEAAYENGSISRGQYQARLAVVAAELRAVERRADRTAGVAERLPPEALREAGANVSHVREIAQRANRTGGGAVAEAAREIGGRGVGDGLGNRPAHAGPPNGSETGAPDHAGGSGNAEGAGPPDGNETGTNASERSGNGVTGPPSSSGNGAANASNATNRSTGPAANAGNGTTAGTGSNASNAANGSGSGNGADGVSGNADNATNRSGNGSGNEDPDAPGNDVTNESTENGTEADAVGLGADIGNGDGTTAPVNGTDGQQDETATDTSAVGRMTLG